MNKEKTRHFLTKWHLTTVGMILALTIPILVILFKDCQGMPCVFVQHPAGMPLTYALTAVIAIYLISLPIAYRLHEWSKEEYVEEDEGATSY